MPVSSNVNFDCWKFPAGEVGVRLNQLPKKAEISVYGRVTGDDIMTTLNLIDAFNRQGIPVTLSIPYFPYTRQDRVCHAGESFALEVMVKALASQADKIDWLIVSDPHSIVFKRLCEKYMPSVKLELREQHDLFMLSTQTAFRSYDYVVGPDAGSSNKIRKIADKLECPCVILDKKRTSGSVFYEPLNSQLEGSILVADDICDGGATFIQLGKMLRETQPKIITLDLYVTHGIFSKGLGSLEEFYDNVYFFNDMMETENAN